MKKLLMIVNEDRFFLSHRLPVALAAQNSGYEVTIVAKNTGSKSSIIGYGFDFVDLPINPTGMNPFQEFKTYIFLKKLYSKRCPDIVHHVGLKNILWGGVAAKKVGVKGVINAVSGLGGLFNNSKLSFTAKSVLKLMRNSNHRKSVKVIFQNNDDMSLFLAHDVVLPYQIEFTKGSGINLEEYSYTPEPSDRKIKIIFTARMVREKGVCDLIEAAEILRPKYEREIEFILCGRLTPNKTGITREYLTSHCDGEYIRWLGERNDVKKLLADSHIMAFPSYYREGVPKSLIEASAIGRPIVTCDSTGCRDVVDNGVNGFLVKPQDPPSLASALKKLIDDSNLRYKMGFAARRKAEREFSIESVVATHLKIYNELFHS